MANPNAAMHLYDIDTLDNADDIDILDNADDIDILDNADDIDTLDNADATIDLYDIKTLDSADAIAWGRMIPEPVVFDTYLEYWKQARDPVRSKQLYGKIRNYRTFKPIPGLFDGTKRILIRREYEAAWRDLESAFVTGKTDFDTTEGPQWYGAGSIISGFQSYDLHPA